jgi:hypothetical protein
MLVYAVVFFGRLVASPVCFVAYTAGHVAGL